METVYLIQYRASDHEQWKDDTCRYSTAKLATMRLESCKASKIMKNSKFRIIERSDKEVAPVLHV